MRVGTEDESLRIAAALKQLREAEIRDARACRAILGPIAPDAQVRPLLRQRIEQCVAMAREWNRQLIRAKRNIRDALYRRNLHQPAFTSATGAGL